MQQIKDLAQKLEDFGLSEKQAAVYVAGLFLGPAPVQRIAEQAGINRSTTYVILEELEDMGLVSESSSGKKTVYITEEPAALENYFQKREEELRKMRDDLKKLEPKLDQVMRGKKTEKAPVVRFYKGKEGIKAINNYMFRKAETGGTVYALTNYDEVLKVFPNVLESVPTKRLKKKLSSKLLYSYSKGDVPTDKKLLRETKKLKQPIQAEINLQKERAALLTYSEDPNNVTGILIESPEIVGALRQLFERAWKNSQ